MTIPADIAVAARRLANDHVGLVSAVEQQRTVYGGAEQAPDPHARASMILLDAVLTSTRGNRWLT